MQKLYIKQDLNPENPREAWDHAATMVCWHRRYKLGDEQPRETPQDWREAFESENPGAVMLPLWLLDHCGITIRTNSIDDPWDSGQVGYVYMTREVMQKEFPDATTDAERRERAYELMQAEVRVYDDYLRGDCWGFVLVEVSTCDQGHTHESHLDSCWGFFGQDAKDAIADALPEQARAMLDAAWEARSYG